MRGSRGVPTYAYAMAIIILGKWGFKPVAVRGCT